MDDFNERLAKLEKQVSMLASQVSELGNRHEFFQGELSDLRDASSTLSNWVEKLAEEANLAKPK